MTLIQYRPKQPPPVPAASPAKPILFLHVPKTAGSSVVTMLNNLFGDANCRRLYLDDPPEMDREIAGIAAAPGALACITGHVPFSFFQPYARKFHIFTMLRDPVARVISLTRFLRRHPERARMGLAEHFTADDVLAARAGEIFPVVNNAMCRMLCRDRRFYDPTDPAYWEIERHPAVLDQAMDTLHNAVFGLTGQMPATWRLFARHFGIPFALDDIVTNVTTPDDGGFEARLIEQIRARNRLDIALYERATALFLRRAFGGAPPPAIMPGSVFAPSWGVETKLADIPGRQGFWDEADGFAWIGTGAPARLHFIAPGTLARPRCTIALRLYGATAEEPFQNTAEEPFQTIEYRLNGVAIGARITAQNGQWRRVETEFSTLNAGLNTLTIRPAGCAIGLASVGFHQI